jgi:hypothetical protein
MAFDLIDIEDDYPCEVALKGAVMNDGKIEDKVFTAMFRRMEQEEINKLLKEIDDADAVAKAIKRGDLLPGDSVAAVTNIEFAGRILAGWIDLTRNGEVMEFNEQNRRAVLQKQGMAQAIVAAWFNIHYKMTTKESDTLGKRATSRPSRGNGFDK